MSQADYPSVLSFLEVKVTAGQTQKEKVKEAKMEPERGKMELGQ